MSSRALLVIRSGNTSTFINSEDFAKQWLDNLVASLAPPVAVSPDFVARQEVVAEALGLQHSLGTGYLRQAEIAISKVRKARNQALHQGFEACSPIKGKVKNFFRDKGFGFIASDGDSDDLFFHIKDCDHDALAEGDCVTCERRWDYHRGRFKASHIVVDTAIKEQQHQAELDQDSSTVSAELPVPVSGAWEALPPSCGCGASMNLAPVTVDGSADLDDDDCPECDSAGCTNRRIRVGQYFECNQCYVDYVLCLDCARSFRCSDAKESNGS